MVVTLINLTLKLKHSKKRHLNKNVIWKWKVKNNLIIKNWHTCETWTHNHQPFTQVGLSPTRIKVLFSYFQYNISMLAIKCKIYNYKKKICRCLVNLLLSSMPSQALAKVSSSANAAKLAISALSLLFTLQHLFTTVLFFVGE